MVNNTDDLIEILPDGVECPKGKVTFGALIEEQRSRDGPKQERTKAEKRHETLYHRWLRMFSRRMRNTYPPEHPIHSDIRYWEFHACHFLLFTKDGKVVDWFFNILTATDRRELCELSRK